MSLFFRSQTVLAGSLEVAKNFKVYLPQFEHLLSEIAENKIPKLREYPGYFEKDLADLSGFYWS